MRSKLESFRGIKENVKVIDKDETNPIDEELKVEDIDCIEEEEERDEIPIRINLKPARRGRPKLTKKEPTLVCDLCEKTFVATKRGTKIHSHKFLVHDIRNCDKCGRAFDDVKKFIAHIGEHWRPKVKLKCEYCGKGLVNKIVLRKHIAAKHTEKNDYCNICDKMVVSLSEHQEQKHNVANLKQCHMCGHTTSAIGIVNHLRRVHKAYVKTNCPNCGKQVRDLNLSRHIKNTQCDRPKEERHLEKFKCNQCEKSFVHQKGLRQHIKEIHNQEKNFKCEQCDYCTYLKSNLYMHVKRVHEKRALHVPCPHCGEQVVNVEYHVKIFHKDII